MEHGRSGSYINVLNTHMGVSEKSVSWTSTFVATMLPENKRQSDDRFLKLTFWTHPYVLDVTN